MSLTRRGAGWNNRIIILLRGDDPRYPLRLKAIADYPGALLVSGGLALLHSAQLAVIGSRSHSWYGACWGKLFSETLAQRDYHHQWAGVRTDGVAHRGALAAEGKTIAVLGKWAGVRFIRGAMQLSPGRSSTMAVRWYLNFTCYAAASRTLSQAQPDYQRLKPGRAGD